MHTTLPSRGRFCFDSLFYLYGEELAYVAAQGAADVAEGSVEAGGQSLHAGGSAEGDQSNNQRIFDQILTFLAACQILELHIHLEKHGVHRVSSPKVWGC